MVTEKYRSPLGILLGRDSDGGGGQRGARDPLSPLGRPEAAQVPGFETEEGRGSDRAVRAGKRRARPRDSEVCGKSRFRERIADFVTGS